MTQEFFSLIWCCFGLIYYEKLQTMIFKLKLQNKEKHKTKLKEICRDYSLPSEMSFVLSILIKICNTKFCIIFDWFFIVFAFISLVPQSESIHLLFEIFHFLTQNIVHFVLVTSYYLIYVLISDQLIFSRPTLQNAYIQMRNNSIFFHF